MSLRKDTLQLHLQSNKHVRAKRLDLGLLKEKDIELSSVQTMTVEREIQLSSVQNMKDIELSALQIMKKIELSALEIDQKGETSESTTLH